jgi:hypothetical protein
MWQRYGWQRLRGVAPAWTRCHGKAMTCRLCKHPHRVEKSQTLICWNRSAPVVELRPTHTCVGRAKRAGRRLSCRFSNYGLEPLQVSTTRHRGPALHACRTERVVLKKYSGTRELAPLLSARISVMRFCGVGWDPHVSRFGSTPVRVQETRNKCPVKCHTASP